MIRVVAMRLFCLCTLIVMTPHVAAFPTQQGGAFTYQGLLKSGTTPINGSVDLQFRLFDAAAAGVQVGSTVAASAVIASNGVFTTTLDFGALALNGEERWVEIDVRSPAGGAGAFVTLSPRQKLASVPYASRALNAMLSGSYADAVTFSNAANAFAGDGSGLTALNASNVASGVLSNARTTGTAASAADTLVLRNSTGGFSAGAISAISFTGDGSGLTNLNATAITTGTLNDARLSASLLARIPQHVTTGLGIVNSVGVGDSPQSIAMSGQHAFVVNGVDTSLMSIDISDPAAPVVVDSYILPSDQTRCISISGSVACVISDDEIFVFDISNPADLALLGSATTSPSPVFVKAVGNRAYVTSISPPKLTVFDISNPAVPTTLGSIATASGPRSLGLNGSVAIVACTGISVLQAIDVANPASMSVLGSISLPIFSDARVEVSGATAFVASIAGVALFSVNVANPAAMIAVGQLPLTVYDLEFAGPSTLIAATPGYLEAIDVSDPANMVPTGQVAVDGFGLLSLAIAGNVGCVAMADSDAVQTFIVGGASFGTMIVQAAAFQGSGAALTHLNAAALTGVVGSSSVAGTYSNNVAFTSASNTFAGSGAGLTNLNASNISTGTLNSSVISGVYDQVVAFSNPSNGFAGFFSGDGADLSNLNAASMAFGTFAPGRLPVGGNWALSSTFSFDNSTLAVDPAANRVGIGTTAPQVPLQINSTADVGTTLGTGAFNIVNGATGLIFDNNEIQSVGGTLAINSNSLAGTTIGGDAIIVTTGDLVGINRTPTTNDFEVAGAASKAVSGSWLANSDRRIKKDIRTVSNALDTLDSVRLTSFRYTPAYLRSHPEIEDRAYLNVIAQEFAKVFPEHVKGSGEFLPNGQEILQVDIHPLTVYSAAAIQELRQQVRTLAEASHRKDLDIDALRDELSQLREVVNQLSQKERRK